MEIITLLRDEHRQVMDLFEKFNALEEPSARQAVADELIQRLMIHEEAEDQAVYRPIRGVLPDPAALDAAMQEQTVLEERLRDLVSQPDPGTLPVRIAEIETRVRAHVATEENAVFPLLLKHASEERRTELGAAYTSAKADHLPEIPSLSISMAPTSSVEQPR